MKINLKRYSRYQISMRIVTVVMLLSFSAAGFVFKQDNTITNAGTTQIAQVVEEAPADESRPKEELHRDAPEEDRPVTYAYTIKYGDSQTLAVRTILNRYNIILDAVQQLYVETNLVGDLGRNDYVAVGEVVRLKAERVEKFVAISKTLSQTERSAWAQYL